jgi:segregation and condensation protein A
LVDYRVNLDIFAGPMDLLLYLVRKEEVDVYDIPIAKITQQYLKYIEILKSLDIDLAGDFLVLAATLMEIKSAMLLPRVEPEQMEAEHDRDPRAELVRQLLAYKKFKDAANLLHAAADQQGERFKRPDNIISKISQQQEPDVDIDQINVWDLLEAFDAVCRATGQLADIRNIKDDTPIDLYEIELLHRLQTEGPLTFQRVFSGHPNRLVMIGLFLALLELVRGDLVWVEQMEGTSDLYLRPLTDEPAEKAVNRIIFATEDEEEVGEEVKEFEELEEATEEPLMAAAEEQEQPHTLPTKPDVNPMRPPMQTHAPTIPIAEIPAKKRSSKSPNKVEYLDSSS